MATEAETHIQDPVTTLTKKEVEILQTSWAKAMVDQRAAGILFWRVFFTDHPDAIDLFKEFKDKELEEILKMARLRAHGVTVMRALTSVIDNLDDADVVVEILKKQGYTHFAHGVRVEHFVLVKNVLLKTLKLVLEDEFQEDVVSAWENALDVVESLVIEGNQLAASESND